ncbi:MAG TPA: MazG nucleotide pyrophosphohydrolase domain-containing protein [Ktedonobacterales bacterium]|nr:MazG nucleotide pyrophosphohydrolase domain-containing protein [Ktedonobacterales bacterium]
MSEQSEGAELNLKAAQAAVDASIQALGGYWPPLANLARLFEECGELARAVNQRTGQKALKPGEAAASVADELGDVLYVTLVLANSLAVDAEAALLSVLEKARRRAEVAANLAAAIAEPLDPPVR